MCEQLLADRAEERAELVEIRWQTKLAGLRARRATASSSSWKRRRAGTGCAPTGWLPATGRARRCARRWACSFSGSTYDGTYIIVDIHLKSDYPTERRAWFDPPTNRARRS